MSHSSVAARPAKPRPDFPLFPHASGRWAKKVRGSFAYFGKVADDPKGEAALNLWLDQKDELLAGRRPQSKGPIDGELTLHDLCNAFMAAKERRVKKGERSIRTLKGYEHAGNIILKTLGAKTLVSKTGPDDFAKLSDSLGRFAVTSRATIMGCIRSIFNFAHNRKQHLIAKPVLFGEAFDLPDTKALDKHRNARKKKRQLSAEQIKTLLNAGNVHWRAMVLVGINCGFGNTDLAELRLDDLDLDGGWVDNARQKTAVERRAKLWPETVAALKSSIAKRPKPNDSVDSDRVFITRYGHPYVRWSGDGLEGKWTDGLAAVSFFHFRNLGINGGASFYSLRRMTETIGGDAKDQVALDMIMGHKTAGMGTDYRLHFPDARLEAVAATIHAWLFPTESPA